MTALNRRAFFGAASATSLGVLGSLQSIQAATGGPSSIALGFDNFSIRAMGWKASELLDYAAKQRVDAVFFSDLDVYESHDEDYLRTVKQNAESLDVILHIGTGSICPTSNSFNDRFGTAEEHLALVIRVAKAVGSPVARCFLGSMRDRQGEGGIMRHIEETIKVCKSARDQALSSGVTIAIENHAGDMTARELAWLIEQAGSDYVGATLDSGNAAWVLEDPIANLEILGPYTVTAHIRDSAVWESENGAMVEWTNMGDGHVDWHRYLNLYKKLCPDAPFNLEIITGIGAREYPYFNVDFWEPYAGIRADDFSRFVAMAKRGEPYSHPTDRPSGERSRELDQRQQLWDLEQSLLYCRRELGLGNKPLY